MPRIITGKFKGQLLMTPEGKEIRPTSDRARTSLFNILNAWLPGKIVLDLYAGCGAIGLECLSRGAKSATFVERAHEAFYCLSKNIERLKAEGAIPLRADVWDFLARAEGPQCDLIYADPPYREADVEKLLAAISASKLTTPDTIVIIEHDETQKIEKGQIISGWQSYRENSYGKARISFFSKDETIA